MKPLGICQPAADQVDLSLRRGDASLRLLLEGVEHVDRLVEPGCVDRAIRVGVVTVDDLHDARAPEAFQRLCGWIGLAVLGRVESLADITADLLRKPLEIRP